MDVGIDSNEVDYSSDSESIIVELFEEEDAEGDNRNVEDLNQNNLGILCIYDFFSHIFLQKSFSAVVKCFFHLRQYLDTCS